MGSADARSGMPPGFEFGRMTDAEKGRMKEALQPFRYVSTHLPWVDTPYFSPFGPSHEYGVRRIDTALEATAFVGAEVANVHVPALRAYFLGAIMAYVDQQLPTLGRHCA